MSPGSLELPIATLHRSNDPQWYVHKHRRELEAAFWDERRVRIDVAPDSRRFALGLLAKFASCVVGLAAVLGIIVMAIR